ncbi:methyltransferase domain-containing protein [Chloroflexota bacterium]
MSEAGQERIDLTVPIAYSTQQRCANRYAFASKYVCDKVVLDIACGPGLGTSQFLKSGANIVIGGDISLYALKQAIKLCGKNVFLLTSAENLPFKDESVDTVVSLETIEHLKSPEHFLSECIRVLRPTGTLICSTPNKKALSPFFSNPGNPYHVREYYPSELASMFSRYFSEVELYGQHMIGIVNRIRLLCICIAAQIMHLLPKGQYIKRVLRSSFVGKLFLHKRHISSVPSYSEVILDKDYAIQPFRDNLIKIPHTIVVVATK